uniref:CSON007412 protein n=1 Tax=Culicoides sonorensis TaxID=179676 RepID=A0A336K017_CULSO
MANNTIRKNCHTMQTLLSSFNLGSFKPNIDKHEQYSSYSFELQMLLENLTSAACKVFSKFRESFEPRTRS